MKRTVISLMALAMLSLGSIGCDNKTKTSTETKTTTPQGERTDTVTHETKTTGDQAPPPAPANK